MHNGIFGNVFSTENYNGTLDVVGIMENIKEQNVHVRKISDYHMNKYCNT